MKYDKRLTRVTYSECYEKYVENTAKNVPDDLRVILDYFAERIGTGIGLEIGSGPMRDANYLRSRGVDILPSDFVGGFLKNDDHAIYFDVTKTDVSEDIMFDGVIANMVLLHLSMEDFINALENIHRHLNPNGFMGFSVKLNTKNNLSYRSYVSDHKVGANRHFTDYKLEFLQELVEEKSLFQIDKIILPDEMPIVWMFCNKI